MISFNGYEERIDELKTFKKEDYFASDDKDGMIDKIFNIYRNTNIYPNMMFTEKGIKHEIIKCYEKEVELLDGTLGFKYNQGSSLCRFLFPNLRDVDCKGISNNSLSDRFNDDAKLKRAIKFCLEHKNVNFPAVPSAIKDGLEMIGGNVASNFSPMKAKAIYEKFCPENGTIYDYSCGFGGRILGALTSKNNYKYIGCEPSTNTFNNLNILGSYIEEALGKKNTFEIFKKGSEEDTDIRDMADFAFSSPPYFSLEKYCDEDTQCYIKFSTLEEWLEGYVRETIKNIYLILKSDSFYAVNIADFNIGKKKVEFVDEWIKISKEEGFVFEEKIEMKVTSRRGGGNNKDKREGIYVFYKAN